MLNKVNPFWAAILYRAYNYVVLHFEARQHFPTFLLLQQNVGFSICFKIQ